MATITNDKLTFDTILETISGKNAVLMDDNSLFIENLSDNDVYSGPLVYKNLTLAERDSLMSFYATNKDIAFTFDDPNDGITKSVFFSSPAPSPKAQKGTAPLHYTITFYVAGE